MSMALARARGLNTVVLATAYVQTDLSGRCTPAEALGMAAEL
jgi:hypothetical protein